MRFIKLLTILTVVASLVACGGRKHTNDIVPGTPTSADSALPQTKHEVFHPDEIERHKETQPKVFRR